VPPALPVLQLCACATGSAGAAALRESHFIEQQQLSVTHTTSGPSCRDAPHRDLSCNPPPSKPSPPDSN